MPCEIAVMFVKCKELPADTLRTEFKKRITADVVLLSFRLMRIHALTLERMTPLQLHTQTAHMVNEPPTVEF